MLKVNEHGVTITLNGSSTDSSLFWFAGILIAGAVVVAMAMILLSIKLAIGALAIFVVVSFIFNQIRQKKGNSLMISSGVLDVQKGLITYQEMNKKKKVIFLADDRIETQNMQLVIYNKTNDKKCQISGFEHAKELEVMKQILVGKALDKRNANIKIKPDS